MRLKFYKKFDVEKGIKAFFATCIAQKYDENTGEYIATIVRPLTVERLGACIGVSRQTLFKYTRAEHIEELEDALNKLEKIKDKDGIECKKEVKSRIKEINNELDIINKINKVKAEIQAYTAERLFDRDGFNGAKFSLMNNYPHEDYKDKQVFEADVNNRVVVIDDV